MIVTLTGENSIVLQAELHRLTDEFVGEHGDLALERIDGEEADYNRLLESLTSLPFLASKKLVVLRSPSKNKQFAENIEQIAAGIPESTEVILLEPKLDKRLSYYKYLKSKTDFHQYNELDVSGLTHWLVERAKTLGGSISSSDARYLIDRVGPNQQALTQELDKLTIYNSKVTRQTIDLLTDEAPQSTIFQLLEAAFAGQSKRVMQLYSEQRALKVEPQQIVAMLAWQLQIFVIIKAAVDRSAETVAKDAKLNPYVVRKSQSVARNLTTTQLRKQVSGLLDIDLRSKRTALDIDEALQNYLLTLT